MEPTSNQKDPTAAEATRKIMRTSFANNGDLRSYTDQLSDYSNGLMKRGSYVLFTGNFPKSVYDNDSAQAFIITKRTLDHITHKENFNPDSLSLLPQLIQNSPLVLESLTFHNSVLLALNLPASQSGFCQNHIPTFYVCAIHMNIIKSGIPFNEIKSIHARDLAHLLLRTIEKNRKIFQNEKTESWLSEKGLQLPPQQNQNSV